jgi:hypothetical protein
VIERREGSSSSLFILEQEEENPTPYIPFVYKYWSGGSSGCITTAADLRILYQRGRRCEGDSSPPGGVCGSRQLLEQ